MVEKLMDLVAQVQDNVKKTVEAMTGLYVACCKCMCSKYLFT